MRLRAAKTAAYLLIVAMFAFGLWRTDQVRLDDRAHDCISRWERIDSIRDMGEVVYRRNANTLISLAFRAGPDLIATYQAKVEDDVAEIRDAIPDPDCDIDAARHRLD